MRHRSTLRMRAGDYSLSRWQSTSRSFERQASGWPDSAGVGRLQAQSRVQQLFVKMMPQFGFSVETPSAQLQGEGLGYRGSDR